VADYAPNQIYLGYGQASGPAGPWVMAMKLRRPGANPLWLAGLTGYPGRTAFCAPGCMCSTIRSEEALGQHALARAGFRAKEVSNSRRAAARLMRCCVSARPIVWFHNQSCGTLAYDPANEALLSCTAIGPNVDAEQCVHAQMSPALAGMRMYRLVYLGQPMGHRRFRVARALAEWVATRVLAPFPDVCADGVLRWHALGKAAMHLGTRSYSAESHLERAPGRAMVQMIQADWQARFYAGIEFLLLVAGKARTAFSNRLRWAAEALYAEATYVAPVRQELPAHQHQDPGTSEGTTNGEDWASFDPATFYLAEAAVMAAGFAPSIASSLLEASTHRLKGTALQEIIYLARAGVDEVRALAALRLAGGVGSAATSTLEQLLYSENRVVQLTAVGSLLRHNIEGLRVLMRLITGHVERPTERMDICAAAALAAVVTHDPPLAAHAISRILESSPGTENGGTRLSAVARAAAAGGLPAFPITHGDWWRGICRTGM